MSPLSTALQERSVSVHILECILVNTDSSVSIYFSLNDYKYLEQCLLTLNQIHLPYLTIIAEKFQLYLMKTTNIACMELKASSKVVGKISQFVCYATRKVIKDSIYLILLM